MDKYIVITSIFAPTEAVRKFAILEGWHLIVVGDRKTPSDWQHPGVTYLSPEDQENLNFNLTRNLPWNHYCRKMVGYLYAISKGASYIMDTDDDNIPFESWTTYPFNGSYTTLDAEGFINIYKFFTKEFIWPRGLPLRCILEDPRIKQSNSQQKIGIWQMLANEDPDVDAIYRLTSNKPVIFDEREPVVLEKNTFSPFNSQNTIFRRELFPLLYLPAFVTFRFTDILRSFVAQPITWEAGYRLGFGKATVIQKRNEHDYTQDFESEVPVYLHAEASANIAKAETKPGLDISQNLMRVYEGLYRSKIVSKQELELLGDWLKDLETKI